MKRREGTKEVLIKDIPISIRHHPMRQYSNFHLQVKKFVEYSAYDQPL